MNALEAVGWDPASLIIFLLVVNIAAMIRGYFMILTVLRAMSGHFEEQGGAKFLISHNALNNISDYLDYRYKAMSAEEQRAEILKYIAVYSERVAVLMKKRTPRSPLEGEQDKTS